MDVHLQMLIMVYISGQINNNFGSDGRPSYYVTLSASNFDVTAGSVSVTLTYYEL